VRVRGQRRADRRLILILCLITFLANAANQPAPSLYPAVARDFGISTALVGQLSTVSNLSGILLTLVLAPLSDAFGRKRLITVGIALTLVAGIASAASPTFAVLLCVRVIGGASWGGIMPSVYSLAAERFSGSMRTTAIGWITSTLSLGGIIANFSFTQIAQVTSWRGSVWVYVAWATIGIVALPRFLPKDPPLTRLPRGTLRSLFGSGLILPFRHGPTRALIASNVARTLHWTAMVTYISLLFADVYGVNIAVIGYLSLITSVGYLVGVNVASRLTPRFGPQRINVWSNVIGFPILVLETALLAPLPIMLAFAMAYHAAMGASYTTQQTLLLSVTPAGKGATGGLNSATVQAGGVFASIVGGVIIGTLGYRWLGPLLGWSGLLAAYLVWRAVSVDAGSAMEIATESPVAADARSEQQSAKAAS
jgi:DHA1 family bicyclomycin/chloramphenicol resistance-like MFS transporter